MSDEAAYVHCTANGCPCAGTNSSSITGSTEWWCAYHFSAAPGRIHEVTAELRRLSWLVQLCKGVRHFINTGIWCQAAEEAYKEIAMHQRSDLFQKAGNATTPPESWPQWLRRLEGVLAAACKAPAAPDIQQPLEV